MNKGMREDQAPDVGTQPSPCPQLPKRPDGASPKGAVRVRTLPCESARSAHVSNNSTQAPGPKRRAVLPGRTVAGG